MRVTYIATWITRRVYPDVPDKQRQTIRCIRKCQRVVVFLSRPQLRVTCIPVNVRREPQALVETQIKFIPRHNGIVLSDAQACVIWLGTFIH